MLSEDFCNQTWKTSNQTWKQLPFYLDTNTKNAKNTYLMPKCSFEKIFVKKT